MERDITSFKDFQAKKSAFSGLVVAWWRYLADRTFESDLRTAN